MIILIPGVGPVEVAEPYVDVAPPTVAPLAWTWSAPWLGQSWNISSLASPVVKLRGATGLGQVDPVHWWEESPTLPGAAWTGHRVAAGSVFMPLLVHAPDSASFLVAHDDFIRSLDPEREAVLRVARPDGSWREIGCRYTSGADQPVDLDPLMAHRAVYGITWTTPDPFWRAEPVSVTFPYATGSYARFPFRYPARLAPTETLSNAWVTNPGDVPAYPTWRITGPFSSFSVGIGASLVEMTYTRDVGGYVEVDMDPRRLTITSDEGADVWEYATDVSFEAIPPGDVALVTTLLGGGPGSSVTLSFTPRYRRAW